MIQVFSQLLSAALGSVGFGLIFNLNRRYLPAAGVGGLLRGLALAGLQTKELCAEDDDCQVTENRIHKESFLYYKIPRTIYIHSFRRWITESRETADPRLPCRSSSESHYIIFLFHKEIIIFFIISFF